MCCILIPGNGGNIKIRIGGYGYCVIDVCFCNSSLEKTVKKDGIGNSKFPFLGFTVFFGILPIKSNFQARCTSIFVNCIRITQSDITRIPKKQISLYNENQKCHVYCNLPSSLQSWRSLLQAGRSKKRVGRRPS